MKVFALHDEGGHVTGLAIPTEDRADGEAGVGESGQHVTEIDLPGADRREVQDVLPEIARRFRVDRTTRPPRLVEHGRTKE